MSVMHYGRFTLLILDTEFSVVQQYHIYLGEEPNNLTEALFTGSISARYR